MERDKNGFLNCKKCSRRFVTEVGIQNHINIQHGSIVLESQKAVHKNASNLPEETVDDRHYQPKECKESHETKFTVQTHNRVYNSLNLYQCKECKKSFATKYARQIHTGVHNSLSPYQCQECKKSFVHKSPFQIHIRTFHVKFTPHQCQECQRACGSKSSLQHHIKTVHEELA